MQHTKSAQPLVHGNLSVLPRCQHSGEDRMVLRHQQDMNTGRHVMPGCVGIGSKNLAIGFFYQPIDGSFTKFFRECKLPKNPGTVDGRNPAPPGMYKTL